MLLNEESLKVDYLITLNYRILESSNFYSIRIPIAILQMVVQLIKYLPKITDDLLDEPLCVFRAK